MCVIRFMFFGRLIERIWEEFLFVDAADIVACSIDGFSDTCENDSNTSEVEADYEIHIRVGEKGNRLRGIIGIIRESEILEQFGIFDEILNEGHVPVIEEIIING